MRSEKTQNIDVRDLTRELPRTVVATRTRRVLVALLGGGLLVAGVAFSALPIVPGFPLAIVGLAVLAREFLWARRVHARLKSRLRRLRRGGAGPRR